MALVLLSRAMAFITALMLGAAGATADGWPVAHGNPANTSYQNVVTAPAATPVKVMNALGTFADGMTPIISAQGNVFLATREGNIIALRSDGTPWWSFQLPYEWSVRSTPAVTSRGELFVLASRIVNDHRSSTTEKRIESQLLGFADGGTLLFQITLPRRGTGGISTAPLNIVRDPGGFESVVFPIQYIFPGGGYYQELWLMAYNRFGVVEGQVKVADTHGTMETADLRYGYHFFINLEPDGIPHYQRPMHAVAVPHGDGLDPSIVVVNDEMGSVARYRFTGRYGDGFTEIERWQQGGKDPAVSAPVVALNGAVLFNRLHDVLVLQTDGTDQLRKLSGDPGRAPPAVLPNGRVLHASGNELQEAGGGPLVSNSTYDSPTATRSYIYSAEMSRLATYRLDDLSLVASYEWDLGGRQQPAVGPLGHIYALTFNAFYIFPPDANVATGTNIGPGGVAGATTEPGSAGAAPNSVIKTGTFNPAILTQPGVTNP
ncbi:hypothetical protein [Dongia sp. agr-C8]